MKIIDLAKLLWKLCDKKEPFKTKYVTSFEHDIQRRIPDVTKMKKILSWESKVKLEEGLKEVIEWLKKEL